MCVRSWCSLLLLLGLLAAPSIAGAQRGDLISQGISLREQGRDEEALALFERAYADTQAPRALAQVALAQQALGRFVEAEANLEQALTSADDAFIRRNREHLEGALGEIRERLGDLTVAGGVDGAEIFIGGQAVGVLPLDAPVRVVAGSVAIEVRAPGYERFIDTVQVRGGSSVTVRSRRRSR
jgi:tetratricopeptide (TPR) repeat protein